MRTLLKSGSLVGLRMPSISFLISASMSPPSSSSEASPPPSVVPSPLTPYSFLQYWLRISQDRWRTVPQDMRLVQVHLIKGVAKLSDCFSFSSHGA